VETGAENGTSRIQHKSMADSVADRLRRMIQTRELAPGERIRQAALAASMGVSTMPVREALLRLVAEGMVLAEANRSFSVASTTEDGIRDIYWMHSVLAGELTVRAWDHRSKELLAELKRCNAAYKAAVKAGNSQALFASNWSFHSAINRAAASPTIVLALKNTLHFFPDFSYDVGGWIALAGRWQTRLIEQFTNGDRESAREVAASSITKACELFIESFWRPAADVAAS
jgi:DNA-binding GntR family transcriptional regulator